MTDEQRKEAIEWMNHVIDTRVRLSDGCPEFLYAIRSALEPKTVSREDAMNLFSFLCDVYRANGNTGTEFILWLEERGIEVEEDK